MLFNYRYIHHDIEKFQTWLDHLVKQVWCQASGDFHLDLLHADLRAVILDIYNIEDGKPRGNNGDSLYGPICNIFNIFKGLQSDQQNKILVWYDNNNDIEALCANDPCKVLGTYEDIKGIDANLEKELRAFCQSLFSNVIHLKAVTSRMADIDAHYLAFTTENDEEKCPYCGYNDIKGQFHSKREAYDHFLPKGTYPFNSVNFRNLAPMCHECNSSYKLQQDPLWHLDPIHKVNAGTRRKAFYSYATSVSNISVDLTFSTSDIDKLCPSDITVTITAPGRDEEVESWKDVFGIEERYKAKCCGKNDGKAWFRKVYEAKDNYGITPQEMLEAEIRVAESQPWSDANFLKKPFLRACEKAGLFEPLPSN